MIPSQTLRLYATLTQHKTYETQVLRVIVGLPQQGLVYE